MTEFRTSLILESGSFSALLSQNTRSLPFTIHLLVRDTGVYVVDPELSKRKTTVIDESFVVRKRSVAYNAHSDSKMAAKPSKHRPVATKSTTYRDLISSDPKKPSAIWQCMLRSRVEKDPQDRSDSSYWIESIHHLPGFRERFYEISETEFAKLTKEGNFDVNGLPVVTPPSEDVLKEAESVLRRRILFP